MKRLIIALLVITPIMGNAQTFWSMVNDDQNHNISHLTDKGLFQDSIILVSGFVNDASCNYHNLFAYNTNGQKLWNIGGYHDLIYTDSDYIYTAGYTTIDDVVGAGQIIISKYDKNGNQLFSIGYPDSPHDFYFEFELQNIDLTSDGTILVSSDKSIVKWNDGKTAIKEYPVNLASSLQAIHAINSITYLINTQNKIYKTDSSLSLIDSIEFATSINELMVKNDTVYTLFNSGLVRLDTSLNIIDTIFNSSVDITNMELYQNRLWVELIQSDSLKLINLQDLKKSDTLPFPILGNDIQFIVSKDNYAFVGNSFTHQIAIYDFQSPHGEIEKTDLPDIELVDFNIDSIVIDYYYVQEDSFPIGYRFNTTLTVKNNGNNAIQSFAIYADLDGGVNCAQNYFYQKFINLEILPGQTYTASLERAYEEGINNNQLCFTCLAPNSNLEITTDNNLRCKTFTITGIENNTQANFTVFPNPVTDYLVIENSGMNIKSIEMIDINGKKVINKIVSGQDMTIETADLTSGLYLLRISSDNKISTQLIIKK